MGRREEGGEGAGGRLIDVPLLLIIISCTQTLLNTENDDSNFFTSIALVPPLVRRPYAPHIVHSPLFAPLPPWEYTCSFHITDFVVIKVQY